MYGLTLIKILEVVSHHINLTFSQGFGKGNHSGGGQKVGMRMHVQHACCDGITASVCRLSKAVGQRILLTSFLRVQVGEGLEAKESKDFASEVAEMAGGK